MARQSNRRAETDRKLFDEAQKPIEETTGTIEIDVYTASSLYKERAIKQIMNAADSSYQSYVDEIMKIMLGEEYEKIIKRRKEFFSERKKK